MLLDVLLPIQEVKYAETDPAAIDRARRLLLFIAFLDRFVRRAHFWFIGLRAENLKIYLRIFECAVLRFYTYVDSLLKY